MKTSIILIIIITGILALAWLDLSRAYWESIGPQWDRMLNPINYETSAL